MTMAVDRSKFRTCQQTSFCRRHRGSAEGGTGSGSKQRFRLIRDSVHLHLPDHLLDQKKASEEKEEAEHGNNKPASEEGHHDKEGEESVWKSLQRRLLGAVTSSEKDGGTAAAAANGKDPYVRGPAPTLVGRLAVSSTSNSNHRVGELEWSVTLLRSGVARIRATEVYGVPGTAHEKPRVTYDDVVLTPESIHPAQHVYWIRGEGSANGDADINSADQQVLKRVVSDPSAPLDNYMAVQYGDVEGAPGMLLLIQLEPFVMSLYRETSDGVEPVPLVVLGGEHMMHFEIRKFKKDQKNEEPDPRSDAKANEGEKGDAAANGKPEKEIVGYWEDGLAIYSDGTREERKVEEVGGSLEGGGDAKVDHRKLLEEQDEEGAWEERFGGHTDSKPRGPMSVGMDIYFPSSKHLYGIPEHASSAVLQTTMGEGSHYSEPYRLYNLDVFEYELDEVMALYGHIPMIVSQSLTTRTAGVFWFNPTETFVDVYDKDDGRVTHWMSESGVVDVFLMPGPDPETYYRQYTQLTGTTTLPPMFSLGYHQCRWNYKDEKDVYYVHGKFEELDYPYDVLWLDIEHTDGKRYFTWDSSLFPNPAEMQQKLAAQGRRMVTIIDPHIFRDDNYYIHKEATAKGLYIKKNDGSADYDGWCWPGSSSYLDFTAEHVRDWWAEQFRYNKYKGSTPTLFTWNDMNEPSVFNGPEVSMQKDLLNLRGDEHREWHNLYGMLFHRATTEGQLKRNDGENVRPFVLSRAFFAGTQRYGAIWTGDNTAEWSHLEISAPMLLSLNSAALSFVGADVGGFFGNPDAELFTRWMQAGAYTPFFRGHAHHDSKRREPWVFDDDTLARLRRAAMERYALLPFWYTVFRHAELTGMPVMRMMWMQYPDVPDLFGLDDQYMVGSDLLVKPVTSPGVTTTGVLFPTDDVWYEVEFLTAIPTGTSQAKSVVKLNVQAPIDKIPVYQRGGSIIPRKLRLRRSTMVMKTDPYTLYIALDRNMTAHGDLYMDDEETFGYRRGESAMAHFSADFSSSGGAAAAATISNAVAVGDGWSEQVSNLMEDRMVERIIVMGVAAAPASIRVYDRDLEFTYSSETSVLVIRKPEIPALADWTITLHMK
jgi:mannosyl-oligosaccharide alpha-1,3-glucosidase